MFFTDSSISHTFYLIKCFTCSNYLACHSCFYSLIKSIYIPLFCIYIYIYIYISFRSCDSCRRLPEPKHNSFLFNHWSASKCLVFMAACTPSIHVFLGRHLFLLSPGIHSIINLLIRVLIINPLQTKRRPLYLKTQSLPHCKHFSPRL